MEPIQINNNAELHQGTMQHITSTDKNLVYVSIVASQRAQSHACTLYFATFTLGSKSGNQRTISSPMMTHKRNGSTKAAEMKSINTLGREEKGPRQLFSSPEYRLVNRQRMILRIIWYLGTYMNIQYCRIAAMNHETHDQYGQISCICIHRCFSARPIARMHLIFRYFHTWRQIWQ